MSQWVARAVLPVAGAVFGAELVGVFEAVRMRDQAQAFGDLASGDAAVLVPLASLVGLLVAIAAMLVGGGVAGSFRPRWPSSEVSRKRRVRVLPRQRSWHPRPCSLGQSRVRTARALP